MTDPSLSPVDGGLVADARRLLLEPAGLDTAHLENTVCAECLGKPVGPAGVTGPVVPRKSVPDLLTGDQFPHLHRDSSPDRGPGASHSTLVMHSALKHGETLFLMAADNMPGSPFNEGNNISVCIECDSAEEIAALFDALSAGGEVTMPLQDMFWNARFGMIKDKFGIHWMLNYTLPPKSA